MLPQEKNPITHTIHTLNTEFDSWILEVLIWTKILWFRMQLLMSKEPVQRPWLSSSSSRLKLTLIPIPLKWSRRVWCVLRNHQGNAMGTRELPDSAHWCTETSSPGPLLTLMSTSVYKTLTDGGKSSRANCPLIRALEQSAPGTVSCLLCSLCAANTAVTDRTGGVQWLGKSRGQSPSPERQESWCVIFISCH